MGQEHATFTRFIGSQGNIIGGESATKHTNSKKIDIGHATDNQHQMHGSIHNGETTKGQKRTTSNATDHNSAQRRFDSMTGMCSMWFGILSIHFAYKGPYYAYADVMKYVESFWVGTKNALQKLFNTVFANVFIGTGSVIIMALYFDLLNDKIHGLGMYALENGLKNEGAWYNGQKYANSTIPGVSGDTHAGA